MKKLKHAGLPYLKYSLIVIASAFVYISLSIYFGNTDLINRVLSGPFTFLEKWKVIKSLYTGFPDSLSAWSLIFLLLIAILSGVNIAMIIRSINKLKGSRKLNLMIGGGMVMGLATTGCAVCGLPLFAFLGISSALAFLPLKGHEFSLLTVILLSVSIFVIRRNLTASCKITNH